MTERAQVMLRGGPSDGVKLASPLTGSPRAIDSLRFHGYTYRDSGHRYHGLRMFDWLPVTGPDASIRALPGPAADSPAFDQPG